MPRQRNALARFRRKARRELHKLNPELSERTLLEMLPPPKRHKQTQKRHRKAAHLRKREPAK